MNFEVKKEDWAIFFDNLSKRRFEWTTEIEVLNETLGHQVLSNGLPLNGLTIETAGAHTLIHISIGETVGHHQSHTIKDPTRIAFRSGDDTHGDVVDIEEADGTKTLLQFTGPMGVLVGIAENEMVLAGGQ